MLTLKITTFNRQNSRFDKNSQIRKKVNGGLVKGSVFNGQEPPHDKAGWMPKNTIFASNITTFNRQNSRFDKNPQIHKKVNGGLVKGSVFNGQEPSLDKAGWMAKNTIFASNITTFNRQNSRFDKNLQIRKKVNGGSVRGSVFNGQEPPHDKAGWMAKNTISASNITTFNRQNSRLDKNPQIRKKANGGLVRGLVFNGQEPPLDKAGWMAKNTISASNITTFNRQNSRLDKNLQIRKKANGWAATRITRQAAKPPNSGGKGLANSVKTAYNQLSYLRGNFLHAGYRYQLALKLRQMTSLPKFWSSLVPVGCWRVIANNYILTFQFL